MGSHSGIAAHAAFFGKVMYDVKVFIVTMGPPIADLALQQAQQISDAEELHLYSDRLFAGADTLGTAEVLRVGIEKIPHKMDLYFLGIEHQMVKLDKQDHRLHGN